MLQVNKKAVEMAREKLGLTTKEWSKRLGLEQSSYYVILASKDRSFTMKHILIAQHESGLEISNFFEKVRQ